MNENKSVQKGKSQINDSNLKMIIVHTILEKYFPKNITEFIIMKYIGHKYFTLDRDECMTDYDRKRY